MVRATHIDGVFTVKTRRHVDSRGSFARLFCEQELSEVIGGRRIVQINHSRTSRVGTVRGMHFQYPPHAEMKMVRCIKGRVWDVAVDLRADSPTFLHWYAVELSSENDRMLVIPEGFAHGIQALEPDSELFYLDTAFYTPAAEGGVRYNDPAIHIAWPVAPTDISDRDINHALLKPDYRGITL